MVTRSKIILIIVLSLITPTILMGHKVILEDKSGLNESTIRNIKNIFLFIVTVILFVLAMYMVKYMYKQFYVQIFFRKVAGSVAISDDWYKEWVKLHRSIK